MRTKNQVWLKLKRATFGSTDRVLRRNAPIWRRAYSKSGRAHDRAEIAAGLS